MLNNCTDEAAADDVAHCAVLKVTKTWLKWIHAAPFVSHFNRLQKGVRGELIHKLPTRAFTFVYIRMDIDLRD